ncbi:MAG: tetratricopeptide repeat protein [Phycisphaerae bacterium]|nr:tetratricopeptide repeat protein [Phycisphaerae bacterium]
MAKKLNKKVAIISIVLVILVLGTIMGWLVGPKIARRLGIGQNPDKALAKARQLLEVGDYENAEKEFGMAYTFGKTDAYKIERLFELAEFHLINNEQHEADWGKARDCWNKITKIDPDNIEARNKLLDFLYQVAEAGDSRVWKTINENITELLEALKRQEIEPDTSLLTKHAKSFLLMAQRGETTNRQELLTKSLQVLESLLEKNPENNELYLLRAQAARLQGELDQFAGIRDALEKNQENALKWLETGIEKSEDKATATANLLMFKLQTMASDPNEIDKLRVEIETRTMNLPPNDKLLLVTSFAYENTGNMPLEAEINQAIEAIRQAHELDPENIEYVIRMYQLLYRKGSSLNDPDAIADAIELAENALLMSGTQDISGPLQGRNRQYRLYTNIFLAEVYLEKTYLANQAQDEDTARNWRQKAEPRIEEIKNIFGTTENPLVQKFEGMLALAKGEQDKAIRLMYKAYEQSKALDKEGQLSDVDPVLCITLANLMKEKDELGMQLEFLRKAIFNRARPARQKPYLFLDYAEIFAKLRSWSHVLTMVNNYQSRYGINLRSQSLKTQALIALNRFDEAAQSLSEIPAEEPISIQLKINLLTSKINQIQQALAQQDPEKQEPSAEQTQELTQLRTEQTQLLQMWLDQNVKSIDAQTLMGVCRDLIQNNQTQTAIMLIDKYLSGNPDNLPVKILKLQAMQENPLEISQEQQQIIQEQALKSLEDPIKRNVGMAQLYRNRGDYENARTALAEIPTSQANDPQVLLEKFEIAVQEEDIQTVESLLRPLRSQNLDGCEGNLFSAQLEFIKENYQLALRRFDESLAIQPLSSQIYFLKGRVYNRLENYESAIENLQIAQKMKPQNPNYARNLASALFSRNTELGSKVTPQQQAEAQQAITRAMVLNPSDWQLQSVYAETISRENPDQALSIRQLLLKNHPSVENALMLGNMATRHAKYEWDTVKQSGLVELAGNAYQQAIQLEPENETARQVYADFLRVTGKDQEAIDLLKDDENLLWKYYLRNSLFEQAQEILNGLYEKNPEDIMVLHGLVLTAEGMGERQQVEQYLDMLMKMDDSKESELWLFQKYLDNGFTAEVEERLPGFKERYPEETIILLIEAWTQMRNGNLEDSLSLTNRYLETETENASAWRLRGRLYRLMNQPQKAVGDLQRSKRIKADPMVRLELASVYNEMGNPQGAIGELKEGLNDPQAPSQLWLTIEATYKKTANVTELEKFYLTTLEKYPQNISWLYRIGNFYLEQKNFNKAQQFLRDAWNLSLQRQNQDVSILVAYIKSLYEGGKYDEAFSLASEFIDTPAASPAYTYMALIQLKLNQPDKANDSFEKALEKAGVDDRMQELVLENMLETVGKQAVESWCQKQLSQDPDFLPAHLLAYRLAQKEGRYNNAVEHLDRCIELSGEEHPAWFTLAIKKGNVLILAYSKTADKDYLDRSISLFEAMLKKQPENPSLLNNLAYLLTDNNTQIETATEYARKAHQSDPANAVYLDTYAYALCKAGQYKEAERNLLRAIQLNEVFGDPVPWDMFKHMGMAYEGQDNNRQAIEYYQKALDAATEIPEEEKQQLRQTIEKLKL